MKNLLFKFSTMELNWNWSSIKYTLIIYFPINRTQFWWSSVSRIYNEQSTTKAWLWNIMHKYIFSLQYLDNITLFMRFHRLYTVIFIICASFLIVLMPRANYISSLDIAPSTGFPPLFNATAFTVYSSSCYVYMYTCYTQ